MDLKKYRSKLIGNESERAVSPVIGVILMVAITVILAAVIAAFVLDMGTGLEKSAQGTVDIEDDGTKQVTVKATSLANADGITIIDSSGDTVTDALTPIDSIDGNGLPFDQTGQSTTIKGTSGGGTTDTVEYDVVAYNGEHDSRSGTTIIATIEVEYD
ncbi:type IV pilin N-terminal domain-containing protein [Natronosalvus caseinilyticus]|uniref:type IV pilin N-terminal domain-containing protein n=1 Tax=Natronosalvus caseinilyticus TaxID=2953747 RepID=UPI0028A5B8EF|nr:type IV pilin N-terminal domain-containing protein [Natronosalvus caseinilyticus]